MNKKTSLLIMLSIVLLGSLTTISCKKALDNVTENLDNTYTTNAKTHSADATQVNAETDQVDNDIDNTLSSSFKMSGSGNVSASNGVPVDATVDSSSSFKTITMTFHGNQQLGSCKKRTGKITIDLTGNRWSDSGAYITCKFDSFKVYNTCTGKSVIINGTKILTNVAGGNLFTLTLGRTAKLIHKVRAKYNVTFIDSLGAKDSAVWNVARVTEISYAFVYGFKTNGDSTINGTKLESWGTTRNGSSFTTTITNLISSTACGVGRPTTGGITHTVGIFPFAIAFGLDANGNPVNPANGCPIFYYYKLLWTNVAGTPVSVLVPY